MLFLLLKGFILFGLTTCSDLPPNCPYVSSEFLSNTYFSTFSGDPGNFDTGKAYSIGEYSFISLMCEPLLDYHYLKRPYELIPLVATRVPDPVYYDSEGTLLPRTCAPEQVDRVAYTFEIQKGIYYADHPCFAKDDQGGYRYHSVSHESIQHVRHINQFQYRDTRELTADDFINAIYRLADPRVNCPVIGVFKQYIVGFDHLNEAIAEELERIRALRKAEQGAFYNQEQDEREHPIWIDRRSFPLEGIEQHDSHRFTLYLKKKYPSFIYWTAMPFFAPIPWEVERMYEQGSMKKQGIGLNSFPVGTGPYKLVRRDPNMELIFNRNHHFNHPIVRQRYPSEGMDSDKKQGLLADAGKALPFIDRVIFKLEKEPTTRWTKFLQGYYDQSGVLAESFDRILTLNTQSGEVGSSEFLEEENIQLAKAPTLILGFYMFNMRDPVWGGLDEKHCKMRQAVSIAIDTQEKLAIFNNGMGQVPMSPLPPNIDAYRSGKEGMNPFVYDWDPQSQQPVRKSLSEAKRLLSEAGYPKGVSDSGEQLTLYFDTGDTTISSELQWMKRQLNHIGVRLIVRTAKWGQHWERVKTGNFQFTGTGWVADFPDPENFLYLFDCPNYMPDPDDPTYECMWSLYHNPTYQQLYEEIKSMERGSRRNERIWDAIRILQHDAPFVFVHIPYTYSLVQGWLSNEKPRVLGVNSIRYLNLDYKTRFTQIKQKNQPVYTPLLLILVFVLLLIVPVVVAHTLRERGKL
jgi:oligopeptide transport system substrate-binding protein